ncbi:MAG: quaternary amine ABC transporter ATP-binding protein [Roseinatronobacter sp.]
MREPAIRFQNVSIIFGSNPYKALALIKTGQSRDDIKRMTGQIVGVHDCTLDVGQGEIVVLMGLSGSGKSTLLRAVNGLNPIVQGDVLVNDGSGLVSIPKAGRAHLRRLRLNTVAMVFQQFGLLPWRSVRENVGLGLELAGMDRRTRADKVEAQLDLVGLAQWADQPVSALSGGMQQRVGLARAFATDAPILLMDEPFSALDPLIRARLQDELLALQERLKRTILFVSHDLDEAFKLGNRIAILEAGRMIQCGTPPEIYAAPQNDHVADFVANMNPLGVLRARDALREGHDPAATGTVDIDMPIRQVMERLTARHDCLRVTEAGVLVGHVSRASVMAALVDRRGRHDTR